MRKTRFIAVVGGKGGVGKSTTCLAVSAILLEQGKKVLGVDCDPQASFTRNVGGHEGLEIVQETNPLLLQKLTQVKGYDFVIADTPPALRDEGLKAVLKVSDFVVMPTSCSKLDLEALIDTIKTVVLPLGVSYRVLLTKVDSRRTSFAMSTQNWLVSQGAQVFSSMIRSYAAYDAALDEKQPITQVRYKNAEDAAGDYRRMVDELLRS
jgi:chromosome partitioning protein